MVLEIISNKYLFLSKYMLILNLFKKKLIVILNVIPIVHTQENIKIIFLVVFAYKVVCIDNKYSKRGKDAVNKFIKAILSEYNNCRK